MNRNEIKLRVRDVFRSVFDDEGLSITEATSPEDIEDWDSLEQAKLLLILSKEFSVEWALDEIQNIATAGDMITAVERKISG